LSLEPAHRLRLGVERVDGRRVHTDMEMWTEIRRKVLVESASKRSIRRDYRISARTLEKIVANAEPPGYRQRITRPKPMLGQFLGVIDEILDADKAAPPKQRHTAKRIYERLRDEYGYTGCSSQVRAAVARRKHYSKEVFVPLSHPPGHAQFDFGEATVVISGETAELSDAVDVLVATNPVHAVMRKPIPRAIMARVLVMSTTASTIVFRAHGWRLSLCAELAAKTVASPHERSL
jgi:transposase